MTICDERLKTRTLRAIQLQEQGCFVLDTRQELPLPEVELHYSRDYDYETSWGAFRLDREARSLLVLRQGTPPETLIPQPRLELVSAVTHVGFVTIQQGERSFELDFQTRSPLDWEALRLLNETLKHEGLPLVVWRLEEADDARNPIIRIANDSAMIFASSAIWDPQEQQLVAAQVVTTSQELLKAIKAILATNGGKCFLTVKTPDGDAYIHGAKRGYISVGSSLAQANAEGTVTAMLHPLSGDPQANTAEHCYIIISPGESISENFSERLDLALPWPVQKEWADYLLEKGGEEGLVQVLPGSGTDFQLALRLEKNEDRWAQLISEGLRLGLITIQ